VARSNYEDTCAWQLQDPARSGIVICRDLDGALQRLDEDPAAIVASRPASHLADSLACLEAGLPTMVENPLAPTAYEAHAILASGAAAGVPTALGVEFSLYPAFHFASRLIASSCERVLLEWEDPANEVRHGGTKRAHPEINVLGSVVPHALSIWRILVCESATWRVRAAEVTPEGDRGGIQLEGAGCEFILRADRAGTARRRNLKFEGETTCVEVAFSVQAPVIRVDGNPLAVPPEWTRLNSTLRLELGALFACADDATARTPITSRLIDYVRVQAEIEELLGDSSR
jgi:hypothetical protein